MNEYERKQQQRRERLERAAEHAQNDGEQRIARADAIHNGIPFGQPILVGHHSEKRHRATLRRAENALRTGFEKLDEAKELQRRAGAVGSGGVSSDDPDSVVKLREQLAAHERERDEMKRANAHFRKHKTMRGYASCSDETAARIDERIAGAYSWEQQPYPKWQIANLGANIRRIAARIEALSQHAATVEKIESGEMPESEPTHYAGTALSATVRVDTLDNRVALTFSARLSKPDYQRVRSFGFVWSPSRNAFVRKLSSAAIYGAQHVAQQIVGVTEPTPAPAEPGEQL